MEPKDFIRARVAADVAAGLNEGRVVTRFPPEPNGYLHLGHVKAICVDFEVAREFGGICRIRFDDTNPGTEREEYALAMEEDVRWLGFEWEGAPRHASDYFEKMYEWAEDLVRAGHAYVDSQSLEEVRTQRGTVNTPGVESPWRNRSSEENLDLLRRMRAGEFADGEQVLRARIDMSHPNMVMRDPVLYRIRHADHYRRGKAWCIYPMYDYAHCLGDAIEGVTHSFCTLEFENNREIYDWIIDRVELPGPRPRQYEFARFELDGAVLSKRRILPLIASEAVDGWDDPRLDTIRGLRRRGVPPGALRRLMGMVGVTKTNSQVDRGKFDFAVREALEDVAPRVMAVLRPLKLVLRGPVPASVTAPRHPLGEEHSGSREIPLGNHLYVERTDFSESPPPGFRGLTPGGSVRLRHACTIRCDEVVRDEVGAPVKLLASVAEGSRADGTLHWVPAREALDAEVRLFDRLFLDEPARDDGLPPINPESKTVLRAKIEPSIQDAGDPLDTRYQFERTGYFWRDPACGPEEGLVFNRIVRLSQAGTASLVDTATSSPDIKPSPRPGSVSDFGAAVDSLASRVATWQALAEDPTWDERDGGAPSEAKWLDDAVAALGAALRQPARLTDVSAAPSPATVDALASATHALSLLVGEIVRNPSLRADSNEAWSRAARSVSSLAEAARLTLGSVSLDGDDTHGNDGEEDLPAAEETEGWIQRARAIRCLTAIGPHIDSLRIELVGLASVDADQTGISNPEIRRAAELRAAVRRVSEQGGRRVQDAHVDLVTRSSDAVDFAARAASGRPEVLPDVIIWMATELRGHLTDGAYGSLPFPPTELAKLHDLVADERVTPSAGKLVLAEMAVNGGGAEEAAHALGLERTNDAEAIASAVRNALQRHPEKVAEYRNGKTGLLGMFMGEVIREIGRGSDPRQIREVLLRALGH